MEITYELESGAKHTRDVTEVYFVGPVGGESQAVTLVLSGAEREDVVVVEFTVRA